MESDGVTTPAAECIHPFTHVNTDLLLIFGILHPSPASIFPVCRPEIDEAVTMIEAIDTSKGGGMVPGDQPQGCL
ncbi:hypothetical protein DCAR_0729146 [Daucus carota subsp. sativus]|uniref:Uncharacterized protein n=1 Tax=Daucus carota subsp. sativus TaxID=79200 RepID=A0A164U1Q4_DAUCS|nr:hypothetical protein DCAR_0729146 [Daucus carota subsp. sativus]